MDVKQIQEKLVVIQKKLQAPKGQLNTFGKYKYRSCEDILLALKPLLDGLVLTLTDEIVQVGDRYYVKAVANLTDGTNQISVVGMAREEETKKGMDGSQITGAASSYARKYALNGMFLIDDSKDSDHTNDGKNVEYITESQVADLDALITETKAAKSQVLKYLGVESLEKLPTSDYKKAVTALENRRKK